jgi:hypothetical protein
VSRNKNGAALTTVKLAADVRAKLAAWAEDNLSNMTVELNRSVRERAERERRSVEAVAADSGAV